MPPFKYSAPGLDEFMNSIRKSMKVLPLFYDLNNPAQKHRPVLHRFYKRHSTGCIHREIRRRPTIWKEGEKESFKGAGEEEE
jgi:hypothetical protein